jgi:hypothetical protein
MNVTEDGLVIGELSHWIPVIVDAKIGEHPIDTSEGIAAWKRCLQVGKPIPPEVETLVAQISSMVAFDYLINNMDRWSGSNAKSSKDGSALYFMDNTLSFGGQKKAHSKVERYLERSQKFSRRMVAALRALDRDAVEQAVTIDADPYPRLLTEKEVDAVLFRREKLLEHIDALIAEHGEGEVLAFP